MLYQHRAEPVWPAFPTARTSTVPAQTRRVSLIAFLQRILTETRVAIRTAAKAESSAGGLPGHAGRYGPNSLKEVAS